ncbi:MAG TPA: type II secretion system F family protein [Sporichthya sp.]|nr:type II secretion system F family protein [Sporichthya sp.]
MKRRRLREVAEAATLADLFAACLAAGCAPVEAVEAVVRARPGPVADHLAGAAARVRAGADPARAWRELEARPELAALGRALARAVESGTAVAGAVAGQARRQRLSRRAEADAAIARLTVLAAVPLGLCFLPAFLCLAVVPVVLDLAGHVLAN